MTQLASSSMGQATLTRTLLLLELLHFFLKIHRLHLIALDRCELFLCTSPTCSCSGSKPFQQLRETASSCLKSWLSVHALDFLSEPLTPSFLVDCTDSSMSFSASAALAETSSLHPRVPVGDILLYSITLRGDLVESSLKLLSLAMIGSATACLIRFVAAFFVARS